MELIMIRHGKTAGNIRKAYIGSTDEPLCEEGVSELKNKIPDRTLGHVFVTSLIRTQQTAGYLFPDAKQEILPELREMDFGVFENRTAEEMRDDAGGSRRGVGRGERRLAEPISEGTRAVRFHTKVHGTGQENQGGGFPADRQLHVVLFPVHGVESVERQSLLVCDVGLPRAFDLGGVGL